MAPSRKETKLYTRKPSPPRYFLKEEMSDNEKTANALYKAQTVLKNIRAQKEEKKIKLIDYIPEPSGGTTRPTRLIKLKCKAKTLSDKPCPFNASCGDFCKKHKPPDGFKI